MIKRRKNYLPSLILMMFLWGSWGWLVTQVEPELVRDILVPGLYLPFFLILIPASWLTLAIMLADSRRGLVISLGINLFLILRVYELGNLLNGLLIAGLVVTINQSLKK